MIHWYFIVISWVGDANVQVGKQLHDTVFDYQMVTEDSKQDCLDMKAKMALPLARIGRMVHHSAKTVATCIPASDLLEGPHG